MTYRDKIIRPNVHRSNKHYAIGDRHGRDCRIVWNYNYLCNQCLSPLMLWVRIPPRRSVFDAK